MDAKEIFFDHYADLTSVLGPDAVTLLPYLVRERIINTDDKEVIEKEASPALRSSKILGYISGPLEAGHKESFEKLLQIMVNKGNFATQKLAKKIMKEAEITPVMDPVNGKCHCDVTLRTNRPYSPRSVINGGCTVLCKG